MPIYTEPRTIQSTWLNESVMISNSLLMIFPSLSFTSPIPKAMAKAVFFPLMIKSEPVLFNSNDMSLISFNEIQLIVVFSMPLLTNNLKYMFLFVSSTPLLADLKILSSINRRGRSFSRL